MLISKNPELRAVIISFLIFAIFGSLGVLPFLFQDKIDLFDEGFGLSCLAFFASMTGFISLAFYIMRFLSFEKVFSDKDILARWSYGKEEWDKYTEEEFKEEKAEKYGLFYLVAAISIVVGIGTFFWYGKNGGWVGLAVIVGLIPLIGFIAWLVPHLNYWRNKSHIGEVIIAKRGAYINRIFHDWNAIGSTFDGVSLREWKKGQMILEAGYSMPTRTGMQQEIVRLPVPKGKEAEAKRVLAKLREAQK